MAERPMTVELSAESHAAAMRDYMREGEARALALGNRGPVRFESDGAVHRDILAVYWRCGFYVLEGVIGEEEPPSSGRTSSASWPARRSSPARRSMPAGGRPSVRDSRGPRSASLGR